MFGLLQLKHPDVGPNFPLSSWVFQHQVDTNHGYSNPKLLACVPEDYLLGVGGGGEHTDV